MNMKKLMAAFTAAAMAVTMSAVSAFAATVTLDDGYVGSWGAGACIPKTELEAIGGDVKVTLDIETKNLANTADQFLLAPMDYDNSWTRVTDQLTSDTMVAKADGFIVVKENQTSVEFVITADTISTLGDSGLGFQVQNVIVKSANLELVLLRLLTPSLMRIRFTTTASAPMRLLLRTRLLPKKRLLLQRTKLLLTRLLRK